ncbi:Hpt domain-containing protein [Desulfovibrio aminophilus]|uniref:Hpt domain-containing protein n=1 Tax=Desulfovibrio aminophilus TaxID=81425 RepID=UPI00339177C3
MHEPITTSWMEEMTAKRPALVARMFTVFLEEEPKRLEAVRKALAAGDAETLRFLAHSLKGASAALGAEILRGHCLALEQAAGSGDLTVAPACLSELEAEMERVFAFMRGHLDLAATT